MNQRGLKVTGIILVGGLGGSPYLYHHLKNRHANCGIAILQSGGMRPRTAICRGAVIKGFLEGGAATISVTSTVSRSNIGVKSDAKFDSGKHNKSDKYWDSQEGLYKARNQMDWYVKKGENVPSNNPILKRFYRMIEEDEKCSFREVLYQCEDEVAPSKYQARMKQLCKIDWKLDIPNSQLESVRHAETGAPLRKVRYELTLKPSGASSEFTCSIAGRKLGASNMAIEYQ